MKKKLIARAFAVTVFVFTVMFGLGKLTEIRLFNAFDPISTALAEFELTDYVFSKIRPEPLPDERIVLVNIGPLSRREVAQQILLVNQHKPRVIGIDGFFNCEGGLYDTINCPQLLDTLGNMMLSEAIKEAGNVVLVSRLLQSDSLFKSGIVDQYDSIEYSDPLFSDNAHHGFANLATEATYQEDVKICKSFFPSMGVSGKKELAFSTKVCMLYDSAKTKRFLARGKEEEIINFKGNFEIPDIKIRSFREKMQATSEYRVLCYAIDWEPLMRGDYMPEMFKDNIVLFGYLGDYFGDTSWSDKFFTPLNVKVAGRANPDMFGLVVHANAVAMILNEDYVNELAEWEKVVIALLVCFINVYLFSWIDRKFPIWFDGLSTILQLLQILIVSGIIVFIFAKFNFKLDLTLTIAALALIGPCFDIYKSLENELVRRLTRRRKPVLSS